MARTTKDPAVERRKRNSEILFGSKLRKVNINELARVTGIPEQTLYRWKKDPDLIPMRSLILLVNVQRLPDETKIRLLK